MDTKTINRFARAEWRDRFGGGIRLELHYRGKSLASFPTVIAVSGYTESLSQRDALQRAEEWAKQHGFTGIKVLG